MVGTKIFPAGAKLRSVSLQGYFTQVSPAAARHAISVVKAVTGDDVRRKVVEPAKCANCHEWFEGHGGNRVYEVQVCVQCHVPGLTTSGRGNLGCGAEQPVTFTASRQKILTFWKFDKTKANAALTFPVDTNNFKDMIHGIHSGSRSRHSVPDARDRTPSANHAARLRRMDFPGA